MRQLEMELRLLREEIRNLMEKGFEVRPVAVTLSRAAKLLDMSRSTLDRRIKTGTIPACDDGRRISMAAIRDFAAQPKGPEKKGRARRTHGGRPPNGKSEAEKIRELTKRR
jgi:hypothetical protein